MWGIPLPCYRRNISFLCGYSTILEFWPDLSNMNDPAVDVVDKGDAKYIEKFAEYLVYPALRLGESIDMAEADNSVFVMAEPRTGCWFPPIIFTNLNVVVKFSDIWGNIDLDWAFPVQNVLIRGQGVPIFNANHVKSSVGDKQTAAAIFFLAMWMSLSAREEEALIQSFVMYFWIYSYRIQTPPRRDHTVVWMIGSYPSTVQSYGQRSNNSKWKNMSSISWYSFAPRDFRSICWTFHWYSYLWVALRLKVVLSHGHK